jgi:transcriptional regulator with XRE-family HTH domain
MKLRKDGRVDVPATLRAARRTRRVSQRQLAEYAAVPRQTLDRIEAGHSDPRVATLEKLLDAIGFQLAVCNAHGRILKIDPDREQLVDWSGRHFPPHWEVRPAGEYPWGHWWGWWRRDPNVRNKNPTHTYWRPYPSCGFEHPWEDAT